MPPSSVDAPEAPPIQPFDFRRPDRISKSQLKAICTLHEVVAKNIASSLSAYLRAYLTARLMSVEQLTYDEFRERLSSPSCLLSLSLQPYESNAVLEIDPALIFPFVEIVLGGSGKQSPQFNREATEIELKLLDSLFNIVLRDFQGAWKTVGNIEFSLDSVETDTHTLRVLGPQEAVVAIEMEIQIGEARGSMRFAIPSVIIRMMRQKFDKQSLLRKAEPNPLRRARTLRRLYPSLVRMEASLPGFDIALRDLLALEVGDVLDVQRPVRTPVIVTVNGKAKYEGRMLAADGKRAIEIGGPTGQMEDNAEPVL
jgi:flagellar motor switch protein FliM